MSATHAWTIYEDGNPAPVGDVTVAAWNTPGVYFAVDPSGRVYPNPYPTFEAAAYALTPHVRRVVPKPSTF